MNLDTFYRYYILCQEEKINESKKNRIKSMKTVKTRSKEIKIAIYKEIIISNLNICLFKY